VEQTFFIDGNFNQQSILEIRGLIGGIAIAVVLRTLKSDTKLGRFVPQLF